MNIRSTILLLAMAVLVVLAFPVPGAAAQTPIVQTIFFYSPTCPHCHDVMNYTLPPLVVQYGGRLEILSVDVTTVPGQALYQQTIEAYQIPEARRGVPTMIIGPDVLVGGFEVPEYLPGLIEQGLAAGGVYWPLLPGLAESIEAGTFDFFGTELLGPPKPSMIELFNQDPVGNSLAVAVLIGMVFSLYQLQRIYSQGRKHGAPDVPAWSIPVFALVGLAAALYLSYVEITQAEAFCGPVGDCNTVQQSEYARIFGLIPVGLLGAAAYVIFLAAWAVHRFGAEAVKKQAARAMWWIAILGTLFSLYLTFLEPFVIGATCAWCITSAIAMTVLLWLTTFVVVQQNQAGRKRRPARSG